MRKILFLAVMLTAILPLCAQEKTTELRRTLTEHYVGDAEKQRAAEWLLDNMQYHGTVRSTLQDEYYNKLTRIAHSTVYPQCEPLIYSLADSVYAVQDKGFKRVADADAVTAEYLMSNIDHAFDRWRNGNFARHLSFEEFCEWLLPYQSRKLHGISENSRDNKKSRNGIRQRNRRHEGQGLPFYMLHSTKAQPLQRSRTGVL